MDLTHPVNQWLTGKPNKEWVVEGRNIEHWGRSAALFYDMDETRIVVVDADYHKGIEVFLEDYRQIVVQTSSFTNISRLFAFIDEFVSKGYGTLKATGTKNIIQEGLLSLINSLCPVEGGLALACRYVRREINPIALALMTVSDHISERYTTIVSFDTSKDKLPIFDYEALQGNAYCVERSYQSIVFLMSEESDAIAMKLKYPDVEVFGLRPA